MNGDDRDAGWLDIGAPGTAYRVEPVAGRARHHVVASLELDEIRKYREEEHDYPPADTTVWNTVDLARAMCFGFVKKGDTRVIAIEPIDF